jgi:deoxyxylulose-5-phosphate synthase
LIDEIRKTARWLVSRQPCPAVQGMDILDADSLNTFDVGAEQHAVTMAAGMATRGSSPLYAVTPPFCNVVTIKLFTMWRFRIFRPLRFGPCWNDGPTHHGV